MSATLQLPKAQIAKIIRLGRFFGRPLRPLRKVGLALMKNGIKPLTKIFKIQLELAGATSAGDTEIPKKCSRFKNYSIGNFKQKSTMKIVKSFEGSSLLIKMCY